MNALKRAWQHAGFVVVGLVLVYCVVHAFDPPRLNWGDSGSDYNVMEAGRNFAHYGFLKLHLTPYLLDPALMTGADGSFIYTHYPQLPDLMNGLERRCGLSSLAAFRLVSIAFAFASLFFFYRLIERFWGRTTAQIAIALWVTNPLWLQHADYLHHIPYLFFFGFGCFYFLDRFFVEGRRRFAVTAGVFLFLTYCSSYDYWFFAPLIVAMMTVRHYRGDVRASSRLLVLLALFAVAAVAFKLATNVWGRGGIAPFLADLHFQLKERGTSSVTGVDAGAATWPVLAGRIERFFSLLFYPIALVWAFLPVLRRRFGTALPGLMAAMPNPWWLVLAALPFLVVFREMWIGQAYPALLMLPFVVVAAAALATILLTAPQRIVRAVGGVVVIAMLGNSLAENASFDKAFFRSEAIASLDADLAKVSVPGQYLLTNHIYDSFYRHYFRRNIVELILDDPRKMPAALRYYTDPRNVRIVGQAGAIYVQHKDIAREMYDKGIYYILAQNNAWAAWGNPPAYHRAIDQLVLERDSVLTSLVAQRGRRLADTPTYTIWALPPDMNITPR